MKKKDIQAQKLFTGYHHFYSKDHQLSIARSSPCSCWDHFSFLLASHPYLNWWHIFPFWIFFISDSGASDVPPFFFYTFFLFFIDLLSWTKFQHADDPCLGYFFERNFLFFRLKEGAMEFYWCFRMNKHGHISLWIMIAWFLKRLTPTTDFSDPQYLSFFNRPIFCLDCPLRVFNLTDFYFFFFWPLFFMPLAKRTWDSQTCERFDWLPRYDVYSLF